MSDVTASKNKIARITAVALMVTCVLSVPAADAATVSITSTAAVDDPNYDLTNTYGIGDWAYWADTSSPASGSPSNEKSGAGLIGTMSVVGGGNLRGSASPGPVYDLDFTDGTAPVSGTATDLLGLLNSQLDKTGVGVQLDVTAPTADPFDIYVWGAAFRAVGTLTATVGAASDSDSSLSSGSSRIPGRFYTVTVDPDSKGQTVNLQMILTTDSGSYANVSIAGVAVDTAPVPEPATMALLGLAACGLGGYVRRRRKA